MFRVLAIVGSLLVFAHAITTNVQPCGKNIPFPLDVDVTGCKEPPCDIIKGTNVIFKIIFVAQKYIANATTLVKAKALGITVPYELPHDVRDVCSNLLYEAACPLYATEDVTYLFLFPIASIYPEIHVKVQIYIVDQDSEIITCFKCDIKVRKGNSTALYDFDGLNGLSTN